MQRVRRRRRRPPRLMLPRPHPAPAQPAPAQPAPAQPAPAQPATQTGRQIDFEARELSYNSETDTITARGDVVLRSEDRSVRADEVSWDRRSGRILATGNIRLVDEAGNQLFTESLELSETFETGAMSELLLALRAGGRLAARAAERGEDGLAVLTDAAYTACAVVDAAGCAQEPSWRITADKVIYDQQQSRVRFEGAVLELFGARLLPLPGLSIRTDGRAESGFLVPDIRITQVNGLELSGEYYWRLADNRDLTLGAYVFSNVAPMASAKWRHLTGTGAYQVSAFGTFSDRATDFTGGQSFRSDPRGYLDANGRFQFSPEWSFASSIRLASDRTFLRRYDLSRDDRLRSTFNLERITARSYLSIAGWATQTLRLNADQGQVPLALPAIDYRQRLAGKGAGRRAGTPGQQPRALAQRRAGHAARLCRGALGHAAVDRAWPAGDADRAGARRRLQHPQHPFDRDAQLSRR
ncbi:MAG: hypothetical protein KatS3mg120_2266 [Erythrobacter sp.]|nr:MAG: hypothetical protein KatS3mg120_2266 [Erythrobacter sp.]